MSEINVLNKIPDIELWKMMSDTIRYICNYVNQEKLLQRLADMIQKCSFDMFFFSQRNLEYDEYRVVQQKHEEFTNWAVGHFFYFSSISRSIDVQKALVAVQIGLLYPKHKYMSMNLVVEYMNILQELVDYMKSNCRGEKQVKAFCNDTASDLKEFLALEPLKMPVANETACSNMLNILLQIFEATLPDILLISDTEKCLATMQNLLYILVHQCISLKEAVLKVFVKCVVGKGEVHFPPIEHVKHQMFLVFETLFKQQAIMMSNDLRKSSLAIFDIYKNDEKCQRLYEFILSNDDISAEFKTIAIKYVEISEIGDSVFKVIKLKEQIFADINEYGSSRIYSKIHHKLMTNFNSMQEQRSEQELCTSTEMDKVLKTMEVLFEITLCIKYEKQCIFIEEKMLDDFIEYVVRHLKYYSCELNYARFFNILTLAVAAGLLNYANIVYKWHFYLYSGKSFINDDDLGEHGNSHIILAHFISQNIAKPIVFDTWCNYMLVLSSNLIDLYPTYESQFLRIATKILEEHSNACQQVIGKYFVYLMARIENVGNYYFKFLTPILQSQSALKGFGPCLPELFISLYADFNIYFTFSDCRLVFELREVDTNYNFTYDSKFDIYLFRQRDRLETVLPKNQLLNVFLAVMKFLSPSYKSNNNELQIFVIKALPYMSKYVINFAQIDIKEWMEIIKSEDTMVQSALNGVIVETVLAPLNSNKSTISRHEEFVDKFLDYILNWVKSSLNFQRYFYMQYALLSLVEKVTGIGGDKTELFFLKCVLFFIVTASSSVTDYAIVALITYHKAQHIICSQLFRKHKPELRKILAHLCIINAITANRKISVSLESFASVLDYVDSKNFILEETRHLLPYFVCWNIQHGTMQSILEEIASYHEVDVKELLTDNYAYIYVHITLHEDENNCDSWLPILEKKCANNVFTLQQTNFILLNELLLYFCEKRSRVLRQLAVMARDRMNDPQISIAEYLQPGFLGVLQYFELKLLSKYCNKERILLSLAELFNYMGSNYVTPLRFKIIAMLRSIFTQNNKSYATLICKVWDAFIHSCELEMLKPQLATICVLLCPLIDTARIEINTILKYLIMDNETLVSDNIIDLFFLPNFQIDENIKHIIEKHGQKLNEMTFMEHLCFLLTYLEYEALEVQVFALQHIRKLLVNNRPELRKLIQGNNGIASCLVDLINYLLQGCREQDPKIRLACAECIGELGAIEPSYLPPPRSIHDEDDFKFSIEDPQFILNSLGVFAKAMQVESNCKKADAFALAIQETLKTYKIAPVENISSSQSIWNNLSISQKELMLPFLTSKYVNVSNIEDIAKSSQIYGSRLAPNFKAWLDNWTTKLIASLKSDKKLLFSAYIPSMKTDSKTLMYFLPHIFTTYLIESNDKMQNEAYLEFTAIISSKRNEESCSTSVQDNRQMRDTNYSDFLNQTKLEIHYYSYKDYFKVIFILFDFLERWMREWIWANENDGRASEEYKKIKNFVGKFNKYSLAKSNYAIGGYPRALMYLEDYIMDNKQNQDEYFAFLSELYYRLDEPDGVAGVSALRKCEGDMEQRILEHQSSSDVSLTVAYCERLPCTFSLFQGLVKSHLSLDNAYTSACIANYGWNYLSGRDETNWLKEAQAEPLWRLGKWDELDEYINKAKEFANTADWGINTGRALLHFRNGNRQSFKEQIEKIRMIQIDSLGTSSLEEGTYQHGYFYIARLHAINELEQIEECVNRLLARPHNLEPLISELKDSWEMRLSIVQQAVKIVEPILSLRRTALSIARTKMLDTSKDLFNGILGDAFLKSAVIAMNSDCKNQAFSFLLQAEEFSPPRLFIEKANWFWKYNEHEKAISTLEKELRVMIPEDQSIDESFTSTQKRMCAEAKLQIACFNDALSNVDPEINIQHYKDSMEMFRASEKNLVALAEYYDRIFQSMTDADKDVKGTELQFHMLQYYGKSMLCGTEYVYQSMPRMLSIWFDYGTRLLDVVSPQTKEERKQNLLKMTKLVDAFLERLPSFVFLTAFSQIISRICHPQKEVYKELNLIIAKLIVNYPQQTLWLMISVIKSSYALRTKRCSEILSDSRLKTPEMTKFLNNFIQLAEKFIDLTNKGVLVNVGTTSISSVLPSLHRLLRSDDFSEIMIPTFKFRKLILPSKENFNISYNPFPNTFAYIVSIEDEMIILPSLQRPRRITIRGSDGKKYIQMLKPKDDLRKDLRLMEFNDIVNQLLSKENESRIRRLNIRLYSVVALNEECGMIEWIPNLVGLRPTLMTIYKQRGLGMRGRELKDKSAKLTDSIEKKRQIYKNILLARHPPVLNDWFRRSFPDAHGWLTARTAYIRTTAVMSMVGHILGLGDRHGENILLDTTCGDVVHVDFNCLFNKGEQFDWPERVPFRLTPNMVAAMGPLGVEGMFRKSCACTLNVLRTHADTLMSIVTPFVYDPLVSWPKRSTSSTNANAEKTNELAMEHLKVIQKRLKGINSKSYSISLSIEGQTNKLIAEATSIDNLCQMYIGWGSYL